MTTYQILSEIENQATYLERARAVLAEVENYFESRDEIKFIPHYAEHILLLLQVAGGLVYDATPELERLATELLEKHKEEQTQC